MDRDIHQATLKRCLAFQREARKAAGNARARLFFGDPIGAEDEQRLAAEAHELMRIRLERLIGVS